MYQLVNQLPKKHKVVITSIVTFVVIMMLLPSEKANAFRDSNTTNIDANSPYTQTNDQNGLKVGKSYPLTVDLSQIDEPVKTDKQLNTLRWQRIKVKKGDNLALIFKRAGFSAQTLHKITSLGKPTKILTKIRPGKTVAFGATKDGRLQQLNYSLDQISTLVVSLNAKGQYKTRTDTKEVEVRRQFATAKITSNFWNAAIESGLNDSQVMNLANIFAWDIDFANDIRDGDEFSVVFEERFIDGDYVGKGNIIAAEFINQDESYQAVRYSDSEYYSPQGRSMKKAFLRAPVSFKYVSSSFKPRRFHPILKRWKAHRGVDYAAKRGTPVVAAGSGKVIRAAYNKYNGHHVFIQHPGGIVTKYLHFSKRKVKRGAKVKQGQLIGLVGSTGLSEAPHLHFEFIVNGVHRNPRTVKMPKARPINKKEKKQFLKVAATAMAELNGNKRVMYAFTNNNVDKH
jgi:murein DD-endopeptidase MepM/ murein hydrolase activator NlpD